MNTLDSGAPQHFPKSEKPLSFTLRRAIISVGGRVLHLLLSGWDQSLHATSSKYLERTGIQVAIDADSKANIESAREKGRGIIISNHESAVFSDYLPLFAELSDDVLKKSIFYTGRWNMSMNEKEFPQYTFRPATIRTRKDVKQMKEQLTKDIETIEKDGGYIFIIPAGTNLDENAEFLSLFRRIIQGLASETIVLANKVHHTTPQGYREIAEELLRTGIGAKVTAVTQITSKLSRVGDWKAMDGKSMRRHYNDLFETKLL